MKVAIIKEKASGESRVATTPDIVKDLISIGLEVTVEKNAGVAAGFSDKEYESCGAKISDNASKILGAADIVLKVAPPSTSEIGNMKKGAISAGMFADAANSTLNKFSSQQISAFSLEFLPRITRAQNMDVLSSQSNIAGYKAVIDAVYEFGSAVPMMMTAAGTIRPAKALILGAGVAGLQAIATAKRLGAVVSAFDVRSAAKEQVESLGASFVEVPGEDNLETKGGYAKETTAAYKKKQSDLIHKTIKEQDIVITTALIPGKPAPRLITDKMVKDMKAGSVIVDLAAVRGGNCALTETNKLVTKHGVKIIGYDNFASRVAKDSSQLYAKNLFNFIKPFVNKKLKRIKIDFEDELVQATLITHGGKIVHPALSKGGSK